MLGLDFAVSILYLRPVRQPITKVTGSIDLVPWKHGFDIAIHPHPRIEYGAGSSPLPRRERG